MHTVNIKHTNTISTTHNIKHKNTISTTHKKNTTHKNQKTQYIRYKYINNEYKKNKVESRMQNAKQECNVNVQCAMCNVMCVNVTQTWGVGWDKSPGQVGVPGLVNKANCSREEAGFVA